MINLNERPTKKFSGLQKAAAAEKHFFLSFNQKLMMRREPCWLFIPFVLLRVICLLNNIKRFGRQSLRKFNKEIQVVFWKLRILNKAILFFGFEALPGNRGSKLKVLIKICLFSLHKAHK